MSRRIAAMTRTNNLEMEMTRDGKLRCELLPGFFGPAAFHGIPRIVVSFRDAAGPGGHEVGYTLHDPELLTPPKQGEYPAPADQPGLPALRVKYLAVDADCAVLGMPERRIIVIVAMTDYEVGERMGRVVVEGALRYIAEQGAV